MIVDFDDEYELDSYGPNDSEFEKVFFKSLAEQLRTSKLSGYALGVPDAGDEGQLCLHRDGIFWTVYISERGKRSNPAFFSDAWGAANYLIWSLSDTKCKKFPSFQFDILNWRKER